LRLSNTRHVSNTVTSYDSNNTDERGEREREREREREKSINRNHNECAEGDQRNKEDARSRIELNGSIPDQTNTNACGFHVHLCLRRSNEAQDSLLEKILQIVPVRGATGSETPPKSIPLSSLSSFFLPDLPIGG